MSNGVATKSRRIRLDQKRRGFFLDGKLQEGFSDVESLSGADRLLIARWADHFTPGEVSDTQRSLLDASDDQPPVSLAQYEFAINQQELESGYLQALFESLSDDQRRFVRDPSLRLKGSEYPLSVGELSSLTGASERQLRSWADEGLIPAFREGSDRRFYSAALIRAFVLSGAPNYTKALVGAAARGEAGQALALIAATFGRASFTMPEELRSELAKAADQISRSSQLMADLGGSELQQAWKKTSPERFKAAARSPALEKIVEGMQIHTQRGAGKSAWINIASGNLRASSSHRTKAEAEARGRELARKKGVEHVIHRRDGSVAETHRY